MLPKRPGNIEQADRAAQLRRDAVRLHLILLRKQAYDRQIRVTSIQQSRVDAQRGEQRESTRGAGWDWPLHESMEKAGGRVMSKRSESGDKRGGRREGGREGRGMEGGREEGGGKGGERGGGLVKTLAVLPPLIRCLH